MQSPYSINSKESSSLNGFQSSQKPVSRTSSISSIHSQVGIGRSGRSSAASQNNEDTIVDDLN